MALFLVAGCSIPKHSYSLIPPAGMQSDAQNKVNRECMVESQKLSNKPLTEEESRLIEGVETGRFSEGGRGRSISSDRYVLCFLNRDYQLLKTPVNWLLESKCETLSKYQLSGIEENRLRHLCETREALECAACQ